MSWAAAHPADELTHVDSVRHRPRRYLFAVNRVGQVTQGLVGYLGQSCLAQNVSHSCLVSCTAITSFANRCANTS